MKDFATFDKLYNEISSMLTTSFNYTCDKNKWYAVTDYRTDNEVNIPRFKFGDGVTMISKLPFVTAAIVDNDMEYWDEKQDAL